VPAAEDEGEFNPFLVDAEKAVAGRDEDANEG
jgi:hypothetical protein